MSDSTASAPAADRRARVALAAMFMFCLVGLGIALDLANIYVASRTDPDFQSFCAVSDGINCTSVALSEYSTVLGAPVAVWAMAGYLFAAFLTGMAAARRRTGFGLGFLVIFGILFSLVSIWLIILMAFLIHSLCILCLAIDIINFTFLGMALFAVYCSGSKPLAAIASDFKDLIAHPLRFVALAAAGFGVLAAAAVIGPRLLPADAPAVRSISTSGANGGQCSVEGGSAPVETQHGVSADGHHWIGAASPSIEINEFTDYQCPFCRKAHMTVRQIVAANPKVRVYHRHLPLDSSCNPSIKGSFHDRACELSKIAVCAGEQGRFWEMNDLLFQYSDEIKTKRTPAEEIAARLELDMERFNCCMADEKRFEVIRKDVDEGNRLGLKGTPAFIIDGNIHYGKIPAEALVPTR